MKKQHKVIFGIFGSLLILLIILNSVFLYLIFVKQDIDYKELDEKITNIKKELDTSINNSDILELQFNSISANVSDIASAFDFSEIIENSLKSVVQIKTSESLGSGFFVYEGYILTNTHVIISGGSTNITTYDGKIYSPSERWVDLGSDISLLKIENSSYKSLRFGNSSKIKVGEKVIAIGNPFGLENSVSEGIVSSIREGKDDGREYLQTDAPLNPGNSGGPLINKEGKVIGINNLKVSFSDGLGFALKSNYAKEIINEISRERLGYNLV